MFLATQRFATSFYMIIEQKYILIAQQGLVIQDWLEHVCVHDPKYYLGTVSSIYYDTPTLYHYFEKRNSDYIKCKIRLRWYDALIHGDLDRNVRCYIECKRKQGTLRQKERKEVFVSAKSLAGDPFSEEEILRAPSEIYEFDYLPPGILVPMLLIRYKRFRYVDPHSGVRIALDEEMCCTHANTAYIPGETPLHFDVSVLEIKGFHSELPNFLYPIRDYLTREAYSKYARCCEHLMQPLGRRI